MYISLLPPSYNLTHPWTWPRNPWQTPIKSTLRWLLNRTHHPEPIVRHTNILHTATKKIYTTNFCARIIMKILSPYRFCLFVNKCVVCYNVVSDKKLENILSMSWIMKELFSIFQWIFKFWRYKYLRQIWNLIIWRMQILICAKLRISQGNNETRENWIFVYARCYEYETSWANFYTCFRLISYVDMNLAIAKLC